MESANQSWWCKLKPTKEGIFEAGVVGGKLIMVILLLVFAFMNHDASFIAKKPAEFLGEAIAIGVGTAIPVIFIAIRRGNSIGKAASAAFLGFLIFFIYHVLMEFAGQNDHTKEKSNTEKKVFLPVTIAALVIMAVLTYLAFVVRKFDMCFSEALLESLVFGLFNAIPFVYIEYNREGANIGKLILTFFKYFFAFFFGCMMLQAGGFWSNVFPLSPELKIEFAACAGDGGMKFSKNSNSNSKTGSSLFGDPTSGPNLGKKN